MDFVTQERIDMPWDRNYVMSHTTKKALSYRLTILGLFTGTQTIGRKLMASFL